VQALDSSRLSPASDARLSGVLILKAAGALYTQLPKACHHENLPSTCDPCCSRKGLSYRVKAISLYRHACLTRVQTARKDRVR
jgi:hypothetical protein